MIQRLSQDIQEDIWLWAHVRRFSTPIHVDIWLDLHHTEGRAVPYEGAWIIQRLDGSYVV